MADVILNEQEITRKYKKIMQHDQSDLLITGSSHTLDEFFITKNNQCAEELNETNKKICLKFLSYLSKYIEKYERMVTHDLNNDNKCAYTQLSLLSSIPTIQGYCFTLEKALINICDYCYSFFLDYYSDNENCSDFQSDQSDELLKKFIKDYMEDVKIMQIKNIDKHKKIKVLCDGNHFILDQRILINETNDLRSDYERLTDKVILE